MNRGAGDRPWARPIAPSRARGLDPEKGEAPRGGSYVSFRKGSEDALI